MCRGVCARACARVCVSVCVRQASRVPLQRGRRGAETALLASAHRVLCRLPECTAISFFSNLQHDIVSCLDRAGRRKRTHPPPWVCARVLAGVAGAQRCQRPVEATACEHGLDGHARVRMRARTEGDHDNVKYNYKHHNEDHHCHLNGHDDDAHNQSLQPR